MRAFSWSSYFRSRVPFSCAEPIFVRRRGVFNRTVTFMRHALRPSFAKTQESTKQLRCSSKPARLSLDYEGMVPSVWHRASCSTIPRQTGAGFSTIRNLLRRLRSGFNLVPIRCPYVQQGLDSTEMRFRQPGGFERPSTVGSGSVQAMAVNQHVESNRCQTISGYSFSISGEPAVVLQGK